MTQQNADNTLFHFSLPVGEVAPNCAVTLHLTEQAL
jgi:hypothetical protein